MRHKPVPTLTARNHVTESLPLPEAVADGPDDELANSMYRLLWTLETSEASVDGWLYFAVIRETASEISTVGLMSLLPSGSIPIQVDVRVSDDQAQWVVRFGRMNLTWLELSESKRWNYVYLYSRGVNDRPKGAADDRHNGATFLD